MNIIDKGKFIATLLATLALSTNASASLNVMRLPVGAGRPATSDWSQWSFTTNSSVKNNAATARDWVVSLAGHQLVNGAGVSKVNSVAASCSAGFFTVSVFGSTGNLITANGQLCTGAMINGLGPALTLPNSGVALALPYAIVVQFSLSPGATASAVEVSVQ